MAADHIALFAVVGIGMACLFGWFLWSMGKLTGQIESDREHLRWLNEMDEKYGDLNPFYRAEADRLRGR